MIRTLTATCILLGALLRIANLNNVVNRTPDEATYTAQATALRQEGLPAVQRMAAEYIHDPRQRLYPPPSRLGYLGLLVATMALTGRTDPAAGALLSCAASVAGLILVALIATRFFHRRIGVAAVFLLAVFPPDLALARRTWQDATVNCIGWLLLYCALRIGSRSAPRWVYVVFVLTGSAFLLVKETSLPIYGLCGCWVVWRLRSESLRLIAAAAVGAGVTVAFLALALGGRDVLWNILAGLGPANAANAYALEYATGPGYWLLSAFWLSSPFTLTLGAIGIAAIWRAKLVDRAAAVGLTLFILLFLAIPMLLPHWLNLRYVSVLFGPLCILAAAGLWSILGTLRQWLPEFDGEAAATFVCAAVLIAAVADYQRFQDFYVRKGSPDLTVRMVFEAARN